MNCPSRTDCDSYAEGWNQNPPALAADTTTRSDLNGIANSRQLRDHRIDLRDTSDGGNTIPGERLCDSNDSRRTRAGMKVAELGDQEKQSSAPCEDLSSAIAPGSQTQDGGDPSVVAGNRFWRTAQTVCRVLQKYAKFVGPGFMVSVAYIDPGNYATDVAAGASFRFRLLFMILVSNIFAIFLQSLCIKLGSVTGLNLAQNCRAHLPRWLNYVLYFFAEAAIIATDMAEVIGTAIALNVLIRVPLVAGCAISIIDVLIILFFYNPKGSVRALRAFEIFVMVLVLGVVICFCFQLSLIKNTSVGEVFRGYLPSSAIIKSKGIYQSCGILGATVMPHSLYLGSGIVQPRLRQFDVLSGHISGDDTDDESFEKYRPSIAAIRSCMSYSIAELAISLFTFALFVNSAILIVAGASLYSVNGAESADLFGIHDLLSSTLASAAGTIFALALLLSGTSAGIVCTIAGQMVSEGALNWTMTPWIRRLITRSISITPSIIVAGAVGRSGLSAALEASQVALSVILPFVSAPLIYFTCRNRYMTVVTESAGGSTEGSGADERRGVGMRNHWVTAVLAVVIWGIIVFMNIALLVLVGLGAE